MKKCLFIFGLLLITFNTSSQCVSGDCLNGFGIMKFTDGGTYEGSFNSGALHGFGYYYYPDGSTYTGEFANNKVLGIGATVGADGTIYYGGLNNNKQHGLGVFENKEGAWAYEWENGEAKTEYTQTADPNNPTNCLGNCVNGYGRITNEDGSLIQAVYKNGVALFGKVSTSTSNYYGSLKNNKAHGYGILIVSTGQYSGYFKDGKKHGKGITVEENGTKTVGDWIQGKLIDPTHFELNQAEFEKELKELIALTKTERRTLKYSEVKFTSYLLEQKFLSLFEMGYDIGIFSDENINIEFPNKSKNILTITEKELESALKKCSFLTYDRYTYNQPGIRISLFSDNDLDTSLTIYYEADYCISGDCQNGVGKKSFEYTYTNEKGESITGNRIYEGDFKNGKRDGNGKEVWPNGRHYLGQFKNGWKHGEGTFTWDIGDKYVGEFVDDWRTGYGEFTYRNGDTYIGTFSANKFVDGTYVWAHGDSFMGSWKNNKKDVGIYNYLNGNSFKGGWSDEGQHGFGTFTWADKSKYVGEFLNGE
ncbi:MAG: hypothetical protein PSN34_13065, partial [Urechidicola sp.]|nr:hypothetical protein [Urechidicola sp.]